MKDLTVCHLPIASLPPPLLTYPHEQRRHISSSHPVCGASAKLGRSCSISTPTIRFSHRKKRIRSPKTAGSTPEQPPITAIFDFENESSPKLKRKESSTQNPLRFPQTNPPKGATPMPNPKNTPSKSNTATIEATPSAPPGWPATPCNSSFAAATASTASLTKLISLRSYWYNEIGNHATGG